MEDNRDVIELYDVVRIDLDAIVKDDDYYYDMMDSKFSRSFYDNLFRKRKKSFISMRHFLLIAYMIMSLFLFVIVIAHLKNSILDTMISLLFIVAIPSMMTGLFLLFRRYRIPRVLTHVFNEIYINKEDKDQYQLLGSFFDVNASSSDYFVFKIPSNYMGLNSYIYSNFEKEENIHHINLVKKVASQDAYDKKTVYYRYLKIKRMHNKHKSLKLTHYINDIRQKNNKTNKKLFSLRLFHAWNPYYTSNKSKHFKLKSSSNGFNRYEIKPNYYLDSRGFFDLFKWFKYTKFKPILNEIIVNKENDYDVVGHYINYEQSTFDCLVFDIPLDYDFLFNVNDDMLGHAFTCVIEKKDALSLHEIYHIMKRVDDLNYHRQLVEQIKASQQDTESLKRIREKNGVYDDVLTQSLKQQEHYISDIERHNQQMEITERDLAFIHKENYQKLYVKYNRDDLDIKLLNFKVNERDQLKPYSCTYLLSVRVKEDDTLESLSQMFNVEVDEIKKLNNMTTNTLYLGQYLIISDHFVM